MKLNFKRTGVSAIVLTALLAGTHAYGSGFENKTVGLPAFSHARKAKSANPFDRPDLLEELRSRKNGVHKAPAADYTLPASDEVNYLVGPDGSDWFYTSSMDYETVVLPGGFAQEKLIKGYSYTIYDSELKEVGTIKDVCTLADDESRVAQVMLDITVTKKFYNLDNKYEVGVSLMMNKKDTESYPSLNYYTKIYSINGDKDADGNDIAIATVPGYIVDAVNASTDSFSENFYITYIEEKGPSSPDDYTNYLDYLADCKLHLTTYKYATYGGALVPVNEYSISNMNLPGDQMQAPYFMSKIVDGRPSFIYSQYEKSFFVDPTGMGGNDEATPDNNLVISIYQMKDAYSSKAEKAMEVKIPTLQDHNGYWSFYSIGNFDYSNDADFENFDSPKFYVTRNDFENSGDEHYINSYYRYNSDGTLDKVIGDRVAGMLMMSDVKGQEPQTMFITTNESGNFIFHFVNLISGEEVMEIPQIMDGSLALMANVDRLADRFGYHYVFEVANGVTDAEGNTFARAAWINSDGIVERIDNIPVGKNISLAKLNINADVLDPFIFHTDNENEYMVLVKRYVGDTSETREELLITSVGKGEIFRTENSEDEGAIQSVIIYDNPGLKTLFVGRLKDEKFVQDFYNIPFVKFAGGEGTAENPYLVATYGDLCSIADNTSAAYRITDNIDASGYRFGTIANFSGTLDGNGKVISNLDIASESANLGMFGQLTGASVRNLTLYTPGITLSGKNTYAGVIAGVMSDSKIENVHLFDLQADGNVGGSVFGSVAGRINRQSEISESSSVNAVVNLPGTSGGGIAGELYTGSKVEACAFSGTFGGAAEIGGIAGTIASDASVKNCHVDASLKGLNTIGGVVGQSSRGIISNNYFEGDIEATTPSRFTLALAVGGVVGDLAYASSNPDGEGGETANEVVVKNNIVKIESLKYPQIETAPGYANQLATVHRIVGRSSINLEPSEDFVPEAEKFIAGNHAVGAFAAVDQAIANLDTTTEGKTVAEGDVNRDFLVNLGFAFGSAAGTPWKDSDYADPSLYFETAFVITPVEINTATGERFTINIQFNSREEISLETVKENLKLTYDAEAMRYMENYRFENNTLELEFESLAVGDFSIEASYRGSVAKTLVKAVSGIDDVTVGADVAITFDGSSVIASGCVIELYNLAGTCVASGREAVSTDMLARGVYVAVATGDNVRKAIKIAVR